MEGPLEVLAANLVGHVALVERQDGDLVRGQLEHLEDEAGLVGVELEELGDGVLWKREPLVRYVWADAGEGGGGGVSGGGGRERSSGWWWCWGVVCGGVCSGGCGGGGCGGDAVRYAVCLGDDVEVHDAHEQQGLGGGNSELRVLVEDGCGVGVGVGGRLRGGEDKLELGEQLDEDAGGDGREGLGDRVGDRRGGRGGAVGGCGSLLLLLLLLLLSLQGSLHRRGWLWEVAGRVEQAGRSAEALGHADGLGAKAVAAAETAAVHVVEAGHAGAADAAHGVHVTHAHVERVHAVDAHVEGVHAVDAAHAAHAVDGHAARGGGGVGEGVISGGRGVIRGGMGGVCGIGGVAVRDAAAVAVAVAVGGGVVLGVELRYQRGDLVEVHAVGQHLAHHGPYVCVVEDGLFQRAHVLVQLHVLVLRGDHRAVRSVVRLVEPEPDNALLHLRRQHHVRRQQEPVEPQHRLAQVHRVPETLLRELDPELLAALDLQLRQRRQRVQRVQRR